VSADYSRAVNDLWTISGSLAFDRETTRERDAPDDETDTVSLQFAVSRLVSDRLSIGAGFGKGVFDKKQGNSWQAPDFSEDWTVGITSAYALSRRGQHNVNINATLEYRFTEDKPAWSFDLGYGYSF